MEHNEILGGNKLIAEFMGIPKCERCSNCDHYRFGSSIYYSPSEMNYHSSWDWLMPVMFKIKNKIRLSVNPDVRLRYKAAENEMRNFYLIGTWFCAVKFIEWYNSQTTQS